MNRSSFEAPGSSPASVVLKRDEGTARKITRLQNNGSKIGSQVPMKLKFTDGSLVRLKFEWVFHENPQIIQKSTKPPRELTLKVPV